MDITGELQRATREHDDPAAAALGVGTACGPIRGSHHNGDGRIMSARVMLAPRPTRCRAGRLPAPPEGGAIASG